MKLLILISIIGLVFGNFASYEDFSKNGSFETISDYARSLGFMDFDNQFSKFKLDHKKHYKTIELESRKKFIFLQNLLRIQENNELYKTGKVTIKMGVGPFADLTEEEFLSRIRVAEPMVSKQGESFRNETLTISNDLPEFWDWRLKGVVTLVKDQGECGSCWAFTTVAIVESGFIKHYPNLDPNAVILSEQELIDCLKPDCNGYDIGHSLKYIQEKGIHQTYVYPYTAGNKTTGTCKSDSNHWKGKIKGYGALGRAAGWQRPASQFEIMEKVKNNGPVGVVFDPPKSLYLYSGGIVTEDPHGGNCGYGHAVALIGWGQENGVPYWIFKNSWGDWWGESGYFRMLRGVNLNCIEDYVYYPTFP